MKLNRKVIKVPDAMCEAYNYDKPASFSRGMEVSDDKHKWVFVSGTASIGVDGKTMHIGNFEQQAYYAFNNVTKVLKAGGVTWNDVVKVTIYLRDMDRDYHTFNKVRKDFFSSVEVNPYPASTCVEARLCRSDLLIEMEVLAIT